MIAVLKRYAMALVFLTLVVVLMLAGTMGVMSFADGMVNEMGMGIEMKPRGEDMMK